MEAYDYSISLIDGLFVQIIGGQRAVFGYSWKSFKTLLIIKDKQIVDAFEDFFTNAIYDDYSVIGDESEVVLILESRMNML